jgi:hypothetical protein
MYKDTSLAQEADLRDIAKQIAGSYTNETEANRAIANAIAQLESGAAQSGINLGSQQYQFNTQREDARRIAQQQAEAEAKQRAFDNALKQQSLDLETRRTNYDLSKPIGGTGGTGFDISSLFNTLGVAKTPTAPKPAYKPSAPKTSLDSIFSPSSAMLR